MDKGKLVELDSLRALMAFAVFVSHVQFLSGTEIWSFSLGGLAVTVFIMLSGFAITRSLLAGRGDYSQYIARRFWRIYPAYGVGLALGILVSWHTPALLNELGWVHAPSVARIAQRTAGEHTQFVQHLAAHLALVHGAIPDTWLYGAALTFNSPAWSLSLEWQFYLVAPALVWLVVRALRLPPVPRVASALLAVAGLLAVRALLAPHFGQVPSFLPQQLLFFLVGIVCAIELERIAASRRRLLAAAAGLMALGAAIGGPTNLLAMAIWTLTLVSCAQSAPAFLAPVRRFMTLRWLALAGEASYSFYIVHEPLLLAAAALLHRLWPTRSHHAFELALLPVAIPVALVSWWMFTRIETPINRWAKGRFHGARLQRVATA